MAIDFERDVPQGFDVISIAIDEPTPLAEFDANTANDEDTVKQIQILATNVHIGNVVRVYNQLATTDPVSAGRLVRDVNRVAGDYYDLVKQLEQSDNPLPLQLKQQISRTTDIVLAHSSINPDILIPRKRSNKFSESGPQYSLSENNEVFTDYFDIIATAQNK
jgi:hypothetical protein